MDELKITKRTEPVMFTIRVDKSIVDFYDDLAQKNDSVKEIRTCDKQPLI